MTRRKFWDIDYPPVVLFVGADDRADALARALRATGDSDSRSESTPSNSNSNENSNSDVDVAYRLERATSPSAALDRLDERPAVDCLWVWASGSLSPEAGLDLVEAAADRDSATSIVFAPTTGNERLAMGATRAGATDYVSASATVDELVDHVGRAVDRGLDRRHDAEKRSVLDAMLTELDVALYAKDERARHVLYADTFSGPDPETALGKTDVELYSDHHGDFERVYEDDREIIENGKRIRRKLEPVSSDGEGWMHTTKVPWIEDGRIRGIVGLTYAVSEFKQQERELVQQIARLQQIPDYVNHDLKNPLTVAQGYLDLAKAGEPGALEEVEDSLEQMEALLDDFYALSEHEFEIETASGDRPIQLSAFVENVWEYVATDGSRLELDVDPDVTIVADASHFRPLLKNLLGNAVSHGSAAGPDDDVTVRVGTTEDGFYVEDDGPGIPADDRDAVFQQGYTTDPTGTGLGLVIVRESVRFHGWDVAVTEGELGGARFEISECLIGTPLASERTGRTFDLTDSVDVGDVPVPGAATGSDGTYRVTGAGENIWEWTNEFHYLYATVDGGVRIQGRLTDLERATEWSKAGFMLRSGLEETAAYGFVGSVVDAGPEVDWRVEPGVPGHNHQIGGFDEEYEWFRLERLDDRVCCSVSTDGDRWELVDRRRVALGDPVVVGIAVCSVSPEDAVEARFEDVSVVGLRERT